MTAPGSPRAHGKVRHLFVKTFHGREASELSGGESLQCVQGWGIEGDVHANRFSPRQILITLASDLEKFAIAPGSLHENMVVSLTPEHMFRPGAAILTDRGVEIRLTMYCEPCSRISHLIPSLRDLIQRRGILGTIAKGGSISTGDLFTLLPDQYALLPESPTRRFQDFVAAIPPGTVVRYADIAVGMGVAHSFVRAMPGYIKTNIHLGLPMHRIVNAQGQLLAYLPNQAEKLTAEGVQIERAKVDLRSFLWQG